MFFFEFSYVEGGIEFQWCLLFFYIIYPQIHGYGITIIMTIFLWSFVLEKHCKNVVKHLSVVSRNCHKHLCNVN